MAQFLRHTPCDRCGSVDNRAEYSDGSTHCFGCGHHSFPDVSSRLRVVKERLLEQPHRVESISLPEDYDPFYFPLEALQWVAQYELTQQDLKRNRVGWSEAQHRLVFPFIVDGHLCAYQGRYFPMEEQDKKLEPEGRASRKVSKWLSRGKIHEFLYILKDQSKELIIVEDPLSAIKLQKFGYSSCPLFGSQITQTQKKCLMYSGYHDLTIWLDRDKLKDAYKYSKELSDVGFNCKVVSTENDPKEIDSNDFKKILD